MTRAPEQRQARYVHLCALLGVQFPPDDDGGMTERDWQQIRDAAAERAQRADDARMYNEYDAPASWGVGY